MKLSEIIKKYRKEHDLSQRQMGARCGLSTGYISLIEKALTTIINTFNISIPENELYFICEIVKEAENKVNKSSD